MSLEWPLRVLTKFKWIMSNFHIEDALIWYCDKLRRFSTSTKCTTLEKKLLIWTFCAKHLNKFQQNKSSEEVWRENALWTNIRSLTVKKRSFSFGVVFKGTWTIKHSTTSSKNILQNIHTNTYKSTNNLHLSSLGITHGLWILLPL